MRASTNVTPVRVIREAGIRSSDLEGRRTYFFDVKEAKTGEKYLVITESRFRGEAQERKRSTVMVLADSIGEFAEAFHEIVKLV